MVGMNNRKMERVQKSYVRIKTVNSKTKKNFIPKSLVPGVLMLMRAS